MKKKFITGLICHFSFCLSLQEKKAYENEVYENNDKVHMNTDLMRSCAAL
jgi:hypothetical protein